jgi:predicted kinase
VLIDGKPVLFDAIEFDERIATGDIFYDLAFLLMDLIGRGLESAANIVLNRYLTDTQRIHDFDALAALPLFMSVRAAIRAKVTAARRRQGNSPAGSAQSARDYAALARKLLTPAEPQLIALGGLSGTGKSLLARTLAPGLLPPPGAVTLRSDVERKLMFGTGETERLLETAYAAEATAKVYATLFEKAKRVVAAGHSVIVDAVFAQPDERADIAKAAAGVTFNGLFLHASLETRLARIGGRSQDASDADTDIARKQEEFDLGRMTWSKVDASGTPEETFIRAEAMLGRR